MTDETPPAVGLPDRTLDRRALLDLLTPAIRETADRVSGERFRVRDGDRERLAYLKTLMGLIQTYNAILTGAKDHRMSWPPASAPMEMTEREKARKAAMDEQMEELLDSLAGIKKL